MSTLFSVMGSNAVLATVLGLVVLMVQRWIGNPALRHALWVLVLLKLVTPPLWSPQLTWLPAVEPGGEATVAREESRESHRPGEGTMAPPLPPGDGVPSSAPVNFPADGGEKFIAEHPAVSASAPPQNVGSEQSLAGAMAAAGRPSSALTTRHAQTTVLAAAAVVWSVGSLVWFALALVRILRFQNCLRFASEADADVQSRTAALGEQLGLRQVPRVWFVPGRVSPMLWSVGGRARLIVPTDLFAELGEESRDALLLHELAHYRRGDHWVRYLELAVMGLYWWNPVVWLVRRELRIAEELACDSWVVSRRPEGRRVYAEMLVKTLGFLSGEAEAVPALASGIGTEGRIEGRLIRIMRDAAAVTVSRWAKVALLVLGLAVLSQTPSLVRAQPEKKPDAPSSAAEKLWDPQAAVPAVVRVAPSVVNIYSEKTIMEKDPVSGKQQAGRKVNGMGTGIIVDGRGYIATTHHVIADVDTLRVRLLDGNSFVACVMAFDRKSDLAIIKIDAKQPLAVMPLGKSANLKIGESVVAVGNASGGGHAFSLGIISSLSRDVEVNETQSYKNLLQTDASIQPGVSGGPLVNLQGEAVGINVAIRAGAQRIGFAMPMDDARKTIDRLMLTLALAKEDDAKGKQPKAKEPAADSKTETSKRDEARAQPENRECIVTVQDEAGRPLVEIDVTVYFRGERVKQPLRTDEKGQIRVPEKWCPFDKSDMAAFLVVRDGDSRIGWLNLSNATITRSPDPSKRERDKPFSIVLLPFSEVVTGILTDKSDKPLSGIRVCVMSWSHPVNHGLSRFSISDAIVETMTGTDGRFRLRVPAKLNVWLGPDHPDWQQHGILKKPDQLDVGRVALLPGGRIEGRVVDGVTGKPRSGESVFAQSQSERRRDPATPAVTYAHAVTDADGRYVLGGLSANRYNVIYTGRRLEELLWKRLLAPAVEGVEVEIGKPKQADFQVRMGQRVPGRLVDAESGKPVENVFIGCYGPSHPSSGAACRMERTAADGTFEFYVCPGMSRFYLADGSRQPVREESARILEVVAGRDVKPFLLKAGPKQTLGYVTEPDSKAVAESPRTRKFERPIPFKSTSDRKANDVQLPTGPTIAVAAEGPVAGDKAVSAKEAAKDPLEGKDIVVTVFDAGGKVVRGIDVAAYRLGERVDRPLRTDERGQIRVPFGWLFNAQDQVPPYLVVRDGETRIGWLDLRAVLANHLHLHRKSTKVAEEDWNTVFRMVLLPRTHVISGILVDAGTSPQPGIRVEVVWLEHDFNHEVTQRCLGRDGIAHAITDAEGRFRLQVPQDTKLIIAPENPKWQRRSVTVDIGKSDIGQIALYPACRIEGKVLDAITGKPRVGEKVFAMPQTAWPFSPIHIQTGFAHTDAEGKYVLGGIGRGRYNVQYSGVSSKSGLPTSFVAPAVEGVDVTEEKPAIADFQVREGRRLIGKVVDEDSAEPIAHAHVGCNGPSYPQSGSGRLLAKTAADGTFEFHVAPGVNWLSVMASGRANDPNSRRAVLVPAEGDLQEVVLGVGPKKNEDGSITPRRRPKSKSAGAGF